VPIHASRRYVLCCLSVKRGGGGQFFSPVAHLFILMRKAFVTAIILGVIFSLCLVIEQVRPLLSCLLGAAACFLALVSLPVAAFIRGLTQWRKSSRWWIGPTLACLLFILAAPVDFRIGMFLTDLEFRSHLQEYNKFVEDVRSGIIPCEAKLCMIEPKAMPPNVISIRGARYTDGSVVVEFLVGSGFPLYHTGYLFNGAGANKDCNALYKAYQDRFNLRPLVGDWYHFSG
jgi:hypothetical protein